MFDEPTHIVSTDSQKNKKHSIKRAASAFFNRFSMVKNDDDIPLQRDLLKRMYSENDYLVKKENGIKRNNNESIGLTRVSSGIGLSSRRQIDCSLEINKNSKNLSRNEPHFQVKDIQRNSREQIPKPSSLFRRPATRLIDLSNVSSHSDTSLDMLKHQRKDSKKFDPFFPIQQERHSVIFPDTRLGSETNTGHESSKPPPLSNFGMKTVSDNEFSNINAKSSEIIIDLPPLEVLITPSQCSTKVNRVHKKKSPSEPITPSDTKEEACLDISFITIKTRPKSKSLDITGSISSSAENKNRNLQKSSDNPPINRSSSTKSTLSISSNVSSKSVFGRMDSHRKESKAINLWHNTVEKLMEKSEKTNMITTKSHSTDKVRAMAKFIIGELYSTEKSFYQLLKFTQKNYMEVMQTAVQGKDPLVKASDVQVLFYALPEMIEVSERLLKHLQKYMDGSSYQDCSPGMALGHIFKDLEKKMVAFLRYATHHKANMKSIRKARNSAFISKIENRLKLQRANNRLGLADYLIAPFQRIPRYGLLIKDLLKYTDTTIKVHVSRYETRIHPLLEAQSIIDGLAITMNEVQQKHTRKQSGFYSFSTQSTTNLTAQTCNLSTP